MYIPYLPLLIFCFLIYFSATCSCLLLLLQNILKVKKYFLKIKKYDLIFFDCTFINDMNISLILLYHIKNVKKNVNIFFSNQNISLENFNSIRNNFLKN